MVAILASKPAFADLLIPPSPPCLSLPKQGWGQGEGVKQGF